MINALLEDLQELAQMPILKGALAGMFAWLCDMVGHPESAARWLFYLMFFDFLLGLSRAWKQGSFKSHKLKSGGWKFFRYWLAIAIFVMADAALQKAIPQNPVSIRDALIAYLAINEAFSCVDHLAYFGMPVPAPFLRRLRHYREELIELVEPQAKYIHSKNDKQEYLDGCICPDTKLEKENGNEQL